MRRSRVRWSASPSTRHPLSDPRLSSGITSETFLVSGDITHLHIFFCESPPLCRPTERDDRNFAAPISRGLLKISRRPAPRSQGCEVARVLTRLDTGRRHKFQRESGKNGLGSRGGSPISRRIVDK